MTVPRCPSCQAVLHPDGTCTYDGPPPADPNKPVETPPADPPATPATTPAETPPAPTGSGLVWPFE